MRNRTRISDVDRELAAWAREVVVDAEVGFGAPAPRDTGRGVSLYLFELGDAPDARGAARTPSQVRLRYLVTAWAPEPDDSHDMLGQLLFAALGDPRLDVDLSPLPAVAWQTLGVPVHPAFVIEAEVVREPPPAPTRRVLSPLVVEAMPTAAVAGRVVIPIPGRPAAPLSGALVELPDLDRRATSDHRGRFRFGTVPRDARAVRVRVSARGLAHDYEVHTARDIGEPVILSFPIPED